MKKNQKKSEASNIYIHNVFKKQFLYSWFLFSVIWTQGL